jgi:hypothetical protein
MNGLPMNREGSWRLSAKIDVSSASTKQVTKNLINEHSASLLDHQICTSLPLIITVYVITQAAVGLHHTYSSTPICNHSDEELSWARYMMSGSAVCCVLCAVCCALCAVCCVLCAVCCVPPFQQIAAD